jgi:hypothetical protein
MSSTPPKKSNKGYLCGHRTAGGITLDCSGTSMSCPLAQFAEADLSPHHDKALARATRQIIKVISQVPPDAEGRRIDVAHTSKGLLLVWVQPQGTRPPKNAVRFDDQRSLERELRLK